MDGGGLWITFDGEIANYEELRQTLEELGADFKTKSDAELILKAYVQWGQGCPAYLTGVWAFAVWDVEKSILFCSRDRLGSKPLHYYRHNEKFLFGSELKQILQDSAVPRVMNEETLAISLVYGETDFNEQTLIQDIVMLKPGHNLILAVDIGNKKISDISETPYWSLDIKYNKNPPQDGYVNFVGKEFSKAVSQNMRGDVPIGALLSGGLDSSCVVTEICEQLKARGENSAYFKTFTSGYKNDPRCDERHFAHMVAVNAGCSENIIYPDETKIMESFEKMIWHVEGLCIFSPLGLFNVLKEISRLGIKVVINGQGGDETMLGYSTYYPFFFMDLLRAGKFGRLFKEISDAKKIRTRRFQML